MLEYLEPILNLLKAEYVVAAGYTLMTIVVFVETGLLIGFCLPGDSLLVTAGLFAARGDLDITLINALLIPAAILGDTLGYWIGHHSGKRLFNRPSSLLFHPEHLIRAQEFYLRHGGKTIIIARFIPIMRTFAPVVAGMGSMPYTRFLVYNVAGGVFWVASLTLVGYFLGLQWPWLVKKLEYIIVFVVFLSILPMLIAGVKNWLTQRAASNRRSVAASEPSSSETVPVPRSAEAIES